MNGIKEVGLGERLDRQREREMQVSTESTKTTFRILDPLDRHFKVTMECYTTPRSHRVIVKSPAYLLRFLAPVLLSVLGQTSFRFNTPPPPRPAPQDPAPGQTDCVPLGIGTLQR